MENKYGAIVDWGFKLEKNLYHGGLAYDAFIGNVDFVSVVVSAIPGVE